MNVSRKVLLWCFVLTLALGSSFEVSAQRKPSVTPKVLKATETKIQNLVEKNISATVSLIPALPTKLMGTGSGVIVSEGGLILTAAHVSMDMGDRVLVIFNDGSRATARVLGMDFGRDAGMLQITGRGKKYPFVEVGTSKQLRRNDWCIAMGHAGGYSYDRTPPVRLGRIISNKPDGFITTDSALIGGDSGGPLFDVEGRLIGIHSNIGFSISQNNHVPIEAYLNNWDRLLAGKRFGNGLLVNRDRAMIGARFRDTEKGVVITEVVDGTPAAKSKLLIGEIITKINDVEVKKMQDLLNEVNRHSAGETAKFVIQSTPESKSKNRTVNLTFASASSLDIEQPDQKTGDLAKGHRMEVMTKEEFNQLMRESIREGVLLPEILAVWGQRQCSEYLKEFNETLSKKQARELRTILSAEIKPVQPNDYDPDIPVKITEHFIRGVFNAFRPSNRAASDSTHLVFLGSQWKSLCTAVHPDGYLIAKASEIEDQRSDPGPLRVMLAKNSLHEAAIVKRYPEHDIALLKITNAPKLTPVSWPSSTDKLPLGTLVSAVGSSAVPEAIGVVSVQSRSTSGKTKGYLGIEMTIHDDGVEVTNVLNDGNAGAAGIQVGDIITGINKTNCDTPEKLIQIVSGTSPGETVAVDILRNQAPQSIKVELRDRSVADSNGLQSPRNNRMNRFGTELSKRSTGYSNAIQTDLPIDPRQCGGPVVDLDGNVIGINISRAGRIKTFALPAYVVKELIKDDLPQTPRG